MSDKFTLTLDASQIFQYQMCPLSWYYRYKENLQLAGADTSAPDKGTLIHTLCDMYYTLRWKEPNESKFVHLQKVLDSFKKNKETKALFPEDNDILENFICDRFILYVNRYFNEDFVLPTSPVSPVELGFSKLLYEDHNVRFIVEGRIDLINVILEDKMVFTDHKTQSRDNIMYSYRPQFKTYAWATGYEYGLINYIGMQEDKTGAIAKKGGLFKRQLINFPKWMIDEWELKMLTVFWEITVLVTDRYIDPFTPEVIEKRIYEHRNDSNCAGPYDSHPCQFTPICEISNFEMKQALKAFKYNKGETWHPWSLSKT